MPPGRNADITSKRYLICWLAPAILLVPTLSLLGFWFQYSKWPTLVDFAITHTLLLGFAMPKALFDLLGLTAPNSIDGTITAAAIFWPVLVMCLLAARYWGSRALLLAGLSMLWLGSWKLQVVGTGMMGL